MKRLGDFLGAIGVGMSEPSMSPPPINEWAAQLAQNAQNAQNAQYNQQWAQLQAQANLQAQQAPMPSSLADHCHRARELFMRRMAGVRDDFHLRINDFLHCQVHGDIVFVFFLLDGKEGIVKEQVDVFPSDQLIAQFRMIIA